MVKCKLVRRAATTSHIPPGGKALRQCNSGERDKPALGDGKVPEHLLGRFPTVPRGTELVSSGDCKLTQDAAPEPHKSPKKLDRGLSAEDCSNAWCHKPVEEDAAQTDQGGVEDANCLRLQIEGPCSGEGSN